MTDSNLQSLLRQELPQLLAQDPLIRDFILRTVSDYYASKPETDNRFDRVLAELAQDRQEQAQKWEQFTQEQAQKWEDNNRKWEQFTQEQAQKWEDNNRKWEQFTQEQSQKWEQFTQEQSQKWEEQGRQNQAILEEIRRLGRKQESSIGALGARWGLASEASFRNALQGILGQSFGVQVLNLTLYDPDGEVFGRPDQVEIDVIIRNGTTIACEIKSSIDKAGMYSFGRKADFYAKHENRPIDRKIVISPMVDRRAVPVAQALGIEVYSYAEDVESL